MTDEQNRYSYDSFQKRGGGSGAPSIEQVRQQVLEAEMRKTIREREAEALREQLKELGLDKPEMTDKEQMVDGLKAMGELTKIVFIGIPSLIFFAFVFVVIVWVFGTFLSALLFGG